MYLVGPYLFSGEEFDRYLARRRAEALDAVTALDDGALSAGPDDPARAVYDRFAMPDTALVAGEAHFTGDRPLQADELESIGVPADTDERYKAITIAIPFEGDHHLLTCRPSFYSAHQPQAEVRDGALHMTYFLTEEEEDFQLEQNFKRQIALIDRTLEVTQWQAMGFNRELMAVLKERFAARAGAG